MGTVYIARNTYVYDRILDAIPSPLLKNTVIFTLSYVFTENFCNYPVGIQNGRIRNSAMTASSSWDANHGPYLARLHRPRRGRLMGAWSSRHKNHNQWLQIDLGKAMKISGINTQGRQDADQWVTAYWVLYGYDGTRFSYVREWRDNVKVICGSIVLF